MTCPTCTDFRTDTGPRFRCYFCKRVFCEDCAAEHFAMTARGRGVSPAELERERASARTEAARRLIEDVPRYFQTLRATENRLRRDMQQAPAGAEGDHLWVKWADVKAALKDV